MIAPFGFAPTAHIRVTNPIASDQTMLRNSLLPAIRKNILENSRRLDALRLFEIGREIHPRGGDSPSLPEETPHFAAAMYERHGDGRALLFELKRLAECLMRGCTVSASQARPFEHPERAASVAWRGEEVGRLFEFHPSLGIEGRASVLYLDLTRTERLATQESRYQPLRRFPTSAFDLSVVADLREPAGEIERRMATAAGSDLAAIEFVREYTGAPLPEGRKSVSYRLIVGAADHTLSSDEAAAIRNRVIEALQREGFELRI